MRFLVDENLSPLLADELRRAGHDVVHTRDVDLATAGDDVVLRRALDEDRVLMMLLANIDGVAADLAAGAIVVLEDERIRVRRLPVA